MLGGLAAVALRLGQEDNRNLAATQTNPNSINEPQLFLPISGLIQI